MPKFSATVTATKETQATYEVDAGDQHEAYERIENLARYDFPDASSIELDEILDEEQTELLRKDVIISFDEGNEQPDISASVFFNY